MFKAFISNQRGGVGKTTTSLTLARYLADRGTRVLMVDTDPQGSISVCLSLKPTSYLSHFIGQRHTLRDCVVMAIEESAGFSYTQGRSYLIYSEAEIVRRRRVVGLNYYVKTRGVQFVDPETGLEKGIPLIGIPFSCVPVPSTEQQGSTAREDD